MLEITQEFLQVSAKLFQHLTTVPSGDERDDFIEQVNSLLDEREQIIESLNQINFVYDENDSTHKMLFELDKGINERLMKVMETIQSDMKDLNKQKKNEMQYVNPYSHLQVMDGMYYDKKK